eukprot:jgi/Tetstr1/421562/TSEL_012506.t1
MAASEEVGGGREAEPLDRVNANVALAPAEFYCALTGGVLADPVRAEDGRLYSRTALEARLAADAAAGRPSTSPHSGEPMGAALSPPGPEVEAALAAFRAAHGGDRAGNEKVDDGEGGDGGGGGIQSLKELGLVFSRLDRLRDILATTLEGWQPPQLVVVGSESAGKSTLLGRLTMMPIFPQHDQLCTRLPIHVRLRRCSVARPPRLEVYDSVRGATVEGPWEIPMGSGWRDILAKMEELVWGEENQGRGVHTGRLLIVHVDSPSVPSLDLVDLPGLVQSPPDMAAATDALVRRYMGAHTVHSIFLAVVPATSKPNDSRALALLQEHGVEGRTIGVLTMCDELPARKVERLRERMEEPPAGAADDFEALAAWLAAPVMGDTVRLANGYVATANEPLSVGDPARHSGGGALDSAYAVLHEQAAAEVSWFEGAGMGDLVAAGRATCNGLVGRVNRLFLDYIRSTWDTDAVRGMAVRAAADAVGRALPGMMQAYMAQLRALRARLAAAVPAEAVLLPEELEARWFGLAETLLEECAAFLSQTEAFWVQQVRAVLSRRMPQPEWPSPGAVALLSGAAPMFQLSRFPRFIEAVMSRLGTVLAGEHRSSTVASVEAFVDRFFDELQPNPHVTLAPDFLASPASVRVRCDTAALVDTLLLVFMRHGTALVQRWLLPELEDAAADLDAWHEACGAEREALRERAADVESALRQVRQLLPAEPPRGTGASSGEQQSQLRGGGGDLQAVSIAHCKVSGECLQRGVLVAGQSAELTIWAGDFEGAPLTVGDMPFAVSVYSSQSSESAESGASDTKDPRLSATDDEVPLVTTAAQWDSDAGLYRAHLLMPPGPAATVSSVGVTVELHGTALAGSPFQLVLTRVAAEACSASGSGLEYAEPGQAASVSVHFADVCGSSVPGSGASLEAALVVAPSAGRPAEIDTKTFEHDAVDAAPATMRSVSGRAWVEEMNGGAGDAVVRFTVDEAERLSEVGLAVRLYGRHIAGSPFRVPVKLAPLGLAPGVLRRLPLSALGDEWALAYDAPYSHATMVGDFPACGEWLFVCAVLEGESTAALGAFGRRDEVARDHTGSDSVAAPHHGAFWYWRPGRAVGFAPNGRIALNHADTCDEGAEERLSWHFHQSGNGGWRVGGVKGLEKDPLKWRKRVYVWPAAAFAGPPAPAPAALPAASPMRKDAAAARADSAGDLLDDGQ